MSTSRPLHHQWKEFYSHFLAHLPKGIVWMPPLPPYYTGYSLQTLYDWDQYFETILQLYCGYPSDYARNGVRIFLDHQQEDGYIGRAINPGERTGQVNFGLQDHVKPFLAQIVWLCREQSGVNWLRQGENGSYYERLRKYFDYWCGPLDVRGGGLSVWRHAGHSGMDNHYERAGEINKATRYEPSYCEGVDLNAYLVREAEALALIAEELGEQADRDYFSENAKRRAALVQEQMWDDAEGIFYDIHAHANQFIRVKHVGTFATLWAGIATNEQAERLVREHLLNECEFWRPWPIPAYAATEPGYLEGFFPNENTACCSWRAHTWVPTNYYTFQGLMRYGYEEEARVLAEKTYQLFLRGRFNEYYTSETGLGTGQKPFWGWSALALFMEPEHHLGIDPTKLEPGNQAFLRMRQWITEVTTH